MRVERVVFGVGLTMLSTGTAQAGLYRVLPSESEVLAGATTSVLVQVETEAGDNTVGFGYFSFAIDMEFSGTAGASGDDVMNVLINDMAFDSQSSVSLGYADGAEYIGVAAAAADAFPPTFGYQVGDVVDLFSFDLAIPASAELGDTITILPSEGILGSLIANDIFDHVAPQRFQPGTLTVVPEPTTGLLLLLLAGAAMRRGPQGNS